MISILKLVTIRNYLRGIGPSGKLQTFSLKTIDTSNNLDFLGTKKSGCTTYSRFQTKAIKYGNQNNKLLN